MTNNKISFILLTKKNNIKNSDIVRTITLVTKIILYFLFLSIFIYNFSEIKRIH